MSEEKLWLLDGTNFSNWKFRIEVFLEDKGLLDCLENTFNERDFAELENDSAAEKQRKRALRADRIAKDRRCKNLLIHRIAEDQLEYVKDKRTAKDVWDALRDAFERVGIAGKLFLKKQFQELRLAEGEDVKTFLLNFEKVLREMRAAGVKTEDEDVVCQLLLSLPRSFDALITALETIEPKQLTLEYVKKRLLDEEVKRVHRVPPSDEECCTSESAYAGRKREVKCFKCGRFGHKKPECPDGRSDVGTESERNPVSGLRRPFIAGWMRLSRSMKVILRSTLLRATVVVRRLLRTRRKLSSFSILVQRITW